MNHVTTKNHGIHSCFGTRRVIYCILMSKAVTKQHGHYDLILASGKIHIRLLIIAISDLGLKGVVIASFFACSYFLIIIVVSKDCIVPC